MGFDPQNFESKSPLTKSEQIAVDHFKKNPGGRGFFPVAEIMARHNDFDEAIQLLSFGLERHPSYSVARVYLAQLLLRRAHLEEAWQTLENSPLPLRGNLTAQLVRMKLAVLLGHDDTAQELAKDLSGQEFQDSDVQLLLQQLERKPFSQVRRDFAEQLKIPYLNLPQIGGEKAPETPRQAVAPDALAPVKSQRDLEAETSFRERVAKGFFASPIQSLFQKPVASEAPNPDLDPLTYARLLRRQGLYAKAGEIYQRLVHESPSNELLRREYNEICELRDTQNRIDRKIDPELVKTMEKVRKIDDRLRLLNELLSGLDQLHNEFI